MRKSFLPIIIFLLLYVSANTEVGAQAIFATCNRSTIESFPEQEKRPVLLYLDESRQAVEEFLRLLVEGKFDEIYKLNKKVKIYVQGNPNVAMDLTDFDQKQGRITHFEYRNQGVIWDLPTSEIDLSGTVGTWYSVKTTKTKNGIVSLLVHTHKSGNKQSPVFDSVFFYEWRRLKNRSVPSWLNKVNPPIERGNCPTINGSLNVKAS